MISKNSSQGYENFKIINLISERPPEIVQANALKFFSEYYEKIVEKEKIVKFAHELQKNKSAKEKRDRGLPEKNNALQASRRK